MEMEFFVREGSDEEWHEFWINTRHAWYTDLGIREENLRLYEHPKEKLSHYSKRTVDIEYKFDFAGSEWGELEGIANRTDFDLRTHPKASKQDLSYLDQESGERFIPYVIEPAAGVDRGALVFLLDAYAEDEAPDAKGKLEKRTVLRLDRRLAPVKVAVLPLSRNADLSPKARDLAAALRKRWNTDFDDASAIGRRYRRQDEIGTPYCVTVDFDTLEDQAVTVRDRDTMQQERVGIDALEGYLSERLGPCCVTAVDRRPRPGGSPRAARPRPWPRRSPPSRPPSASPWPPRTRPRRPTAVPGRAGRCPTPPAGLTRPPRPGPVPAPSAAGRPIPWSRTRTPSSPRTPFPAARPARASTAVPSNSTRDLPSPVAGQIQPDESRRDRGSPDDPAVHVAGAAGRHDRGHLTRGGRGDRVGVQVEAAEPGHLTGHVQRAAAGGQTDTMRSERPIISASPHPASPAARGALPGRRAAPLRYPQHLVPGPGQALPDRRAHLPGVQEPYRDIAHAPLSHQVPESGP